MHSVLGGGLDERVFKSGNIAVPTLGGKTDNEECTGNDECNSNCCITQTDGSNVRKCGQFFPLNTDHCFPREPDPRDSKLMNN